MLKVYGKDNGLNFELQDGVSSVDLKLDGKNFIFELVGKEKLNVNFSEISLILLKFFQNRVYY